jgi:lysosomal alpha-mannosidase
LLAQFGFDGVFLGRVDYQDFDQRGKTKTREMLWQASSSLGKQAQLFTGILQEQYSPPDGFCFDTFCSDDPIMDDPNLDEYNVDEKVDQFIEYVQFQRQQYKTDNIILTMGDDFQYANAHMWFKNLDKLIYHVNQRQLNADSKVNAFYSTTACYLYSLYTANMTWSTKSDDFFPYADQPHTFWTGYFTSRPAFKKYVRQTNNFFQAIRHIVAYANMKTDEAKNGVGALERYKVLNLNLLIPN